jgi:hypothetical protein
VFSVFHSRAGLPCSLCFQKDTASAASSSEKFDVSKGHGLSRAIGRPKEDAALAAEGMQVVEKTFPQELKLKNLSVN